MNVLISHVELRDEVDDELVCTLGDPYRHDDGVVGLSKRGWIQ